MRTGVNRYGHSHTGGRMKLKQIGYSSCALLLAMSATIGCGVGDESQFASEGAAVLSTVEWDGSYWAVLSGMPDLDQRRTEDLSRGIFGLPGGGGMYCGPAAAMNLLSYIGSHGYPEVSPSTIDFEPRPEIGPLATRNALFNASNYNLATMFLATLGDEMNTSTDTGTSTANLARVIENRLPSSFEVKKKGNRNCEGDIVITPQLIYNNFDAGKLMILKYGKYEPNSDGSVSRTGGHYVTLTGVLITSDRVSITYKDPYRDRGVSVTDTSRQSPFVTDTRVLEEEEVRHRRSGRDCRRDRWRVLRPESTSTARWYMEQLVVVKGPSPF
jgi:hypothetical protein